MLLKADADYNPAEKAIFSAAKDGEKIYVTYNSVDYSKQSTLTTLTSAIPKFSRSSPSVWNGRTSEGNIPMGMLPFCSKRKTEMTGRPSIP